MTYDTGAEADADRAKQKQLLAALDAWDRALRRDECSAWCITGSSGRIYTWGDGNTWVLYVECRSARHWSATKARLAFCTVTQDGEDEGCLRLHGLPTPEQAETIREALGIRKRRTITPEEIERLSKTGFRRQGSAGAIEPVCRPTPTKVSVPELEVVR